MSIGTILLERGLITPAQAEAAIQEHRASGERLERVLVRQGAVTRQQVLGAISAQFHMPVVDLAAIEVDPAVIAAIPPKMAFKHRCIPIARHDGTLTVATCDPFDSSVLDELRLITGCAVELVLADEDELREFIRGHYGVGGDTLDAMAAGLADEVAVEPKDSPDELEQAQEASVIRLVNDLLTEAIAERATDIHIEPYERDLVVRYRIDGVLQRANVSATIVRFGAAIISRLKIMASLNISEKRRPQDGRITFRHRGPGSSRIEEFDLRLSVIPMLFGEGVVLRVLNKSAATMPLEALGMPEAVRIRWETLIGRPHGILLVTGPTGSGKSTTLYASMNRIVSDAIKVITVEDPVEYHVSGVNQIQVNPKVGLDFAAGLRSILRHDPDVVMIGEIRDKETAETAVQASLTGHLVFSTLHTNDAAGAMTRLLDMGVEPFLVASSVEAVLAQRLVRRVCEECGAPHVPTDLPPGLEFAAGDTPRLGPGCRACRNTGYRGRVGIYELLAIDDTIRPLVMERKSAPEIARAASREGLMSALIDDGYAKVRAGVTTVSEVVQAIKA